MDMEDSEIKGETVETFIRWLGKEAMYSFSSVERVIGPSLKRLSNNDISLNVQQACRDVKRE